MTNDKKLNSNGIQLSRQLAAVIASNKKEYKGRLINVAGVGGVVSSAYEQLRNAAEYAQEHLLIQNAIRRYFMRNLSFHSPSNDIKSVAEELVIELTQSGYIKNNSQSVDVIEELNSLIKKHYGNYWRLKASGIDEPTARSWTLDLLSLGSENILVKDAVHFIYAQFAFNHYKDILKKDLFVSAKSLNDTYEVSLYIAVHRALLKYDIAAVRFEMQKLYKISDQNINDYAQFHNNIDDAFISDTTNKIVRYINKYGAPLRIFRSMIQDEEKMADLLTDSDRFDKAFSNQIKKEYKKAESKLNRGLIKSIIFLLITKSLIGISIEVPFDILIQGEVLLIPLLVNLFTPIIYMALLRLGFKLPGVTNARAMRVYAEDMLYGDKAQLNLYPALKEKSYPIGFTIAYTLLFLAVFTAVSYGLYIIGFNIVQGLMFFTFLAAASFLGFRLSRIVRELELVAVKPGAITTIRDLIFTPFTFLGKWLSDKYQRVNIVALFLDTLIELPLKTVLRLLRQWNGFIDDKKQDF